MNRKKRIVLGVSGGIAAFKAASIASQLTQRHYEVRVIMTKSATEFITPLTLQTLSRNPVSIDTFDERNPEVVNHIDLADSADLFLIAPATANLMGKLAHGLADDMLTTTLLATQAPVVLAPAMNVHMYQNPIVEENMTRLRELGYSYIEPGSGQLACGYVGKGRMAEPEEIVEWVENFFLRRQPLRGKKVLITAGPTVEAVDPVRYFTNHSSGKMGYALAQAAQEAGAKVTLISGPVALSVPSGVTRYSVQTAHQMLEKVLEHLPEMDLIIKAAAVADYRPKVVYDQKLKKNAEEMTITLTKNPDIASEVGKRKRSDQVLVGFAAETQNVREHALSKLERKEMDFIVANDVSLEGAGFGVDTNIVTIYDRAGTELSLPLQSKQDLAKQIIEHVGASLI
ncbi:bifunctional phosphopantothenoylcysteine decarboxylase/phosphopantothenate--cysteine ligase CoaBC [Risungbinella massiliensis]|uniref:bifunctional phosphopantothenoylcysteine decarboxylase/phosphopantothenate--cysteine ligase CoaBC n=1 Tax=Risungbinella massiliensis TaxID=1329796 RepID=UPI0005CC4CD2|nr:bifunctional phosphopantothenoylcysteine decarboxylase/phosphopantothenate--cysteine ligase CoaBC [Risungbinella massiliensis]